MTTTPTLNDVDIATVATLTEAVETNPENGATTWKARVDWNGGFRSESHIRDFAVDIDEPTTLGGADSAPNPVELLLASLGGCLVVGVAANATARGIELSELSIELEGELDLQTFLGLTDGHAGYSSIRASIDVDSDADDAEIEALVEHVVATSPVGHTLTTTVPVEVALTR